MFGWEFESLPRYAFPLFPTQAYDLRRFGTPGRNGLRNPRELRLAAARSDDRQLLAHQRSSGTPYGGPLSEAQRTRFAHAEFFAFLTLTGHATFVRALQ